MALIQRFGRLLKADVNAVLDRIEEPESLLQQALRDMETALAVRQSRIDDLEEALTQLEYQKTTSLDRLSDIEKDITLCLEQAQEALLREAVKRKLLQQRQLQHSEDQIKHTQRALSTESQQFDAEKQQLDDIQQQVDNLRYHAPSNLNPISDAYIDMAVLREKSQRSAS